MRGEVSGREGCANRDEHVISLRVRHLRLSRVLPNLNLIKFNLTRRRRSAKLHGAKLSSATPQKFLKRSAPMGAQSLLVGSEYLNKEIFSGRKKGRGGGPYQKKGTLDRAGLTEQAARTKHAATTALYFTNTRYLASPAPGYPRLRIAASS